MAPQVNGEVRPSSATLSHITDYPVVHDGITYFKKNPLGQKSIELGDSAYQTFAKPVMPYFAKPYQYVSPYVEKADMIGDDALSKIDERLPVLKKSSDELWTDGKSIIFFPLRKSMETKDHFFTVYNSEYKKCGGDNLVTYSKALVSTGLVMTSEVLSWVGDVLRASKAHAKESGNQMEEQLRKLAGTCLNVLRRLATTCPNEPRR
ncbi:hypothetical protein GGR56DRAFT_11176 [Xylariaceae sp. FL0804]|nr:hypothetical protein GGR56DRAFT_11176 [Xylariaceae sp. FL0804]